uniref:Uncharacterized protein LOC109689317 isoform X2 n=1 Tax=Castor canadensis TaxID=51338 RepID=A0A8B7UXM2_CASCN|nr:uncharacterized protein LOC109689317 isoform X2 [Castor canadensis]
MRVPEPRGQVRGRWSPQHLASLSCPFSPGCRTTIWTHRVHFLEEQALPRWASFTIWNAGKQGRRLYRSLTAASQHKVVAFCDVDENKIRKGFYCYEDTQERPKPRIPILHFRAAQPPFVICVKLVSGRLRCGASESQAWHCLPALTSWDIVVGGNLGGTLISLDFFQASFKHCKPTFVRTHELAGPISVSTVWLSMSLNCRVVCT